MRRVDNIFFFSLYAYLMRKWAKSGSFKGLIFIVTRFVNIDIAYMCFSNVTGLMDDESSDQTVSQN